MRSTPSNNSRIARRLAAALALAGEALARFEAAAQPAPRRRGAGAPSDAPPPSAAATPAAAGITSLPAARVARGRAGRP